MIKGQRATWHTWDDKTGDPVQVPVIFQSEFYEPGDPVPGYNLTHAETGEPICGIDARDVVPV